MLVLGSHSSSGTSDTPKYMGEKNMMDDTTTDRKTISSTRRRG